MEKTVNIKKEEYDYYICKRCKTNTNDEKEKTFPQMIPCPRGSCEAKIAGTVTIETKITLDPSISKEQKKWNKENYRD